MANRERKPSVPHASADQDEYRLADEPTIDANDDVDAAGATCPICLRRIPADESACVVCRFDARRGLQADTIVGGTPLGEAGLTCDSCGHQLRGIVPRRGGRGALRCPECATTVTRRRLARRGDADAAIAVHEHVRVPLIATALGLAAILLVGGVLGSWVASALLVATILVFAPLCAAILKVAAAFGLEIDAPWALTTVHVAATTSVVLVVTAIAGLLLPDLFAFILALLVAVVVVEQLFEVDHRDALLLAIVIGVLFLTFQNALAWGWPTVFAGLA